MAYTQKLLPTKVPKAPQKKHGKHQHLWVCGESKDGKIPAVCKRCGEETEFSPFLRPLDTRK